MTVALAGDVRLCFCNSPVSVQSVCETQRQCYARIGGQATSRSNNSTWMSYGCEEELEANNESCSSDSSTESTARRGIICCKEPDLCNMPNRLRAVILDGDKEVTRDTRSGCIGVGSMKLICLLVPSLLVVLVMFLAVAMMYKLTKFHAKQIKDSKRTCTYLIEKVPKISSEETFTDNVRLKSNYDQA